jgi:hypothetical protein
LMKREYPTVPNEAFENAILWAYYLKETHAVLEQKRLCRVNYDNKLQVYTAWDLGGAWGGDDTAIWFWQKYGREIRIIDFWQWNGYSMIDIINNVVNDKDYNYDTHFLPHDAKVHEYTTWKTRFQEARESLRWYVTVLEKTPISDGINAVRTLFSQCYFDEVNCSEWFSHLTQYSRSYDNTNGMFRDKPNHDIHSNAADAFRYFALACNRDSQEQTIVYQRPQFQSFLTN